MIVSTNPCAISMLKQIRMCIIYSNNSNEAFKFLIGVSWASGNVIGVAARLNASNLQ